MSQHDIADFKSAGREGTRARVASFARTRWARITNSWRLQAGRLSARRTKNVRSDNESDRPMQYQMSFYTLQ